VLKVDADEEGIGGDDAADQWQYLVDNAMLKQVLTFLTAGALKPSCYLIHDVLSRE